MISLNISHYSDYREFLKDWFWASKKAHSKVSFRFIARHLGLTSPNHFHLVISRKRHFSVELIDRVAKFLKLSPRERQYFKLLFQFEMTQTPDEKKKLLSKATQVRGQLVLEDAPDTKLSVVGNQLAWYIKMGSVVFEGKTKEDLVKLVIASCQFPVTELDSYQAIQILEDAKMLCFVDGLAIFEGGAIVTKWDFDRSEIKRHHEENLKLAAASVAWPISQRFLSSVTVPANAALSETFIEEIRSLCRSVFEKSNSAVLDSNDATEVVTLQVSLFPFFRFGQKT